MFQTFYGLSSLAAKIGGRGTLAWYARLPLPLQERADELAAQLADQTFGKPLEELNRSEARLINELTKHHFA